MDKALTVRDRQQSPGEIRKRLYFWPNPLRQKLQPSRFRTKCFISNKNIIEFQNFTLTCWSDFNLYEIIFQSNFTLNFFMRTDPENFHLVWPKKYDLTRNGSGQQGDPFAISALTCRRRNFVALFHIVWLLKYFTLHAFGVKLWPTAGRKFPPRFYTGWMNILCWMNPK